MKQSHHLSAKQLGFILIAISIVLFLIFLSYTFELMEAADIECKEICGPDMGFSCPHARSIPLQSYIGFSVTFVLAGMGVFMVLSGKRYREELTEKERNLEKTMKTLSDDERMVCETIRNSGGALFQSGLIEKTGFSKVKISRILDKLEGKNLVERRRQGMTNLVLMK